VAAGYVSPICTASFRSSSSSNYLPPRNFFRCRKRRKLLGAKSGLYGGVFHLFPLKSGDEVLSLSSRVRPSVSVKEKNGGTQHAAPFVLNCTPQLLQRFTINSRVYCCVLGQKFYEDNTLSTQNTVHMIFLVGNVCLNFFLFGEPICFKCKDCSFDSGVIWDTHV